MRLKCGCVHVGLMGVKVIWRGFVLNDIETEGARFFANACAGEFSIERDELVHVLRLDGDVRQYAVHCNLLGLVVSRMCLTLAQLNHAAISEGWLFVLQ